MNVWQKLLDLVHFKKNKIQSFTVTSTEYSFVVVIVRDDGSKEKKEFWHDEDLIEFIEGFIR